jgi:hypothetical protein
MGAGAGHRHLDREASGAGLAGHRETRARRAVLVDDEVAAGRKHGGEPVRLVVLGLSATEPGI